MTPCNCEPELFSLYFVASVLASSIFVLLVIGGLMIAFGLFGAVEVAEQSKNGEAE